MEHFIMINSPGKARWENKLERIIKKMKIWKWERNDKKMREAVQEV
jgi:hypothetical protein